MPEIFLPSLKKEEDQVSAQSDIDALFDLIKYSPYQQRSNMHRHILLDEAAQAKADDMATKNYFDHHSPEGLASNDFIRATGYVLPSYYAAGQNYCESISIGGNEPGDNVAGWYRSERHRVHVFGIDSFYREQECAGIGHAMAQDGRHMYVLFTAHCMG